MIYRNCGLNCPGSTGGLLDLPVRTDTSNVVSCLQVPGQVQAVPVDNRSPVLRGVSGVLGVVSDPYLPVCCDICALPIKVCRCVAGVDY